jgi:hypothetical protein
MEYHVDALEYYYMTPVAHLCLLTGPKCLTSMDQRCTSSVPD